jgi:hypothetical protein
MVNQLKMALIDAILTLHRRGKKKGSGVNAIKLSRGTVNAHVKLTHYRSSESDPPDIGTGG